MTFKLIAKRKNRIAYQDKVVVLNSSIRFPIKLRKKKKGFYKFVNFYKDGKKIALEFTDDQLTGFAICKDRVSIVRRNILSTFKPGIYDYVKKGDLYIIDMKFKDKEAGDAISEDSE